MGHIAVVNDMFTDRITKMTPWYGNDFTGPSVANHRPPVDCPHKEPVMRILDVSPEKAVELTVKLLVIWDATIMVE